MNKKRVQRRARLHPEGWLLLVGMVILFSFTLIYLYFACATRLAFWITLPCLMILSALAFYFFRQPLRIFQGERVGAVVAPSDGKVVVIEPVFEPEVLKREALQVSIFMSVFNVHAQWIPVDGRVSYVKHHAGRFMAAHLPKSSLENEHSSILFTTTEGHEVLMRQVAGAVARRVVTYVEEGEECRLDEQLGFIKFGSRIDLYLPLGSEVAVRMNEKVVGNSTLIARLPQK